MKRFNLKYVFCAVGLMLMAIALDMVIGTPFDDGQVMLATATAGFAALDWQVGQNNMGGYKSKLLFIPADCVSAVPSIAASPATNSAMVTASGAFTFKQNAAPAIPVYLYSTDGMVGFNAEAQGEQDGISFKQTLTFFFPGNLPEMHAFNALVKNTPGYYVIEDTDGRQLIVGLEGLPASTSPSFAGGQARADRRGTTYTVTCDSNYSSVFLGTPIDMAAVAGGGSGYQA